MKNVAIIMAGGKGTRFWPLSTTNKPKQFLKLTDSDETMIEMTINRISNIVNKEDIFIVTNKMYKNVIREYVKEIPDENIIYEPIAKNTAPCIALASCFIKKKYGDANVMVFASDHIIEDNNKFLDTLNLAIKNLNDNIITLGIVPERPDTGYGYIEMGNSKDDDNTIYSVKKFVEKPNLELAKEYCDSGKYLWNSGMFIWKNSFMEKCLEEFLPNIYKEINNLKEYINTDLFEEKLSVVYSNLESISIDYGVMEKINNILVIPSSFGWDDVGSWLSIERHRNSDTSGNILDGNIVTINTTNSTIINDSDSELVTVVGEDNLIVVKSDNRILIMKKNDTSNIKQLLEKIKEEGKEEYL